MTCIGCDYLFLSTRGLAKHFLNRIFLNIQIAGQLSEPFYRSYFLI